MRYQSKAKNKLIAQCRTIGCVSVILCVFTGQSAFAEEEELPTITVVAQVLFPFQSSPVWSSIGGGRMGETAEAFGGEDSGENAGIPVGFATDIDYGCSNSASGGRTFRAQAAWDDLVAAHTQIANSPGADPLRAAESTNWLIAHSLPGATYTHSWPDGSESDFTVDNNGDSLTDEECIP